MANAETVAAISLMAYVIIIGIKVEQFVDRWARGKLQALSEPSA